MRALISLLFLGLLVTACGEADLTNEQNDLSSLDAGLGVGANGSVYSAGQVDGCRILLIDGVEREPENIDDRCQDSYQFLQDFKHIIVAKNDAVSHLVDLNGQRISSDYSIISCSQGTAASRTINCRGRSGLVNETFAVEAFKEEATTPVTIDVL